MPSGVPFLRSLARGLSEQLGDRLQDSLILVPTRRAARALADAFVDHAAERGVSAALLPRLRPLADVNPDEPPFEPGELAGRVNPAMDPAQRRFEIAKLVAHYHARAADLPLDPAIAVQMADPLISIMDDAALEGVKIRDHAEWKKVCADSAEHFQDAATLYQIIERYWPERLAEIGMMEPAARRVALLDALSETWRKNPPSYPVVVAGSTGTLKATARLMAVVADMPDGIVVLPGLQTDLPDRVWDTIDVRHPQASLKGLLSVMGRERGSITNWPWVADMAALSVSKKRRRILAEALVPVNATGDWLGRIESLVSGEGADVFSTALADLSLLEARSDTEEAAAIALIMRETLETSGRTAALVTPDQLLAQRVRAALARWNIDVAMSQGVPLPQTGAGVFMGIIMTLAQDPDDPVALSALFNHPLCALGQAPGEVCRAWQKLERKTYRGVRPSSVGSKLIDDLFAALAPLLELEAEASADAWASALVSAAETMAHTDSALGAARVWSGDDGRQASTILDSIAEHGGSLPATNAHGFARLMMTFMDGSVVRPSDDPHPRLSILGPLEARLLEADVMILGGLNEGTWPASADVGPFLSRGMRRAMKLSLPERRYGLAAHDFAELAANPIVFLTRSLKDEKGPTVASRWVWRLKTLLRGAMPTDDADALLGTGQHYLDWARQMDQPSEQIFIERPSPTPPVDKRWARKGREISITGVSKWIRDPYSLFGREVLRLKPLDPLDAPLAPRDYGTAMHAGIEAYIRETETPHDPSHKPQLEAHFAAQLRTAGYAEEDVFKERLRIKAIAAALINWFAERHAAGFDIVGTEVETTHKIEDLNFTLVGKLDLVERSPLGYTFTDFKTGEPPSPNVVKAGFDVQLPLAGWLAEQGALKGLPAADTQDMAYVRVKGSNNDFKYASAIKGGNEPTSAEALKSQAIAILRELIASFDREETGYPSQPRVQHTFDYGDYDDLARRAEWSAVQGGEE